jgi:guanylate kinase
MLFVLSSPSGAGKTSLARRLLAAERDIRMSVSLTTRKPRTGEVDGVDYFFVDETGFKAQRDSGALLEWAHVFGNLYGTPRGPVMDAIAAGDDVLFDVDWQGAQQLRASAGADVVSVFILPPSTKVLEERLISRAQDAPEIVAARMARASEEMGHWHEYDYVIVNRDLDAGTAALRSILAAERLRRSRLTGMSGFVRSLQTTA